MRVPAHLQSIRTFVCAECRNNILLTISVGNTWQREYTIYCDTCEEEKIFSYSGKQDIGRIEDFTEGDCAQEDGEECFEISDE